MADSMKNKPLADWLSRNRKILSLLLQASASILAVVGTFLAKPPEAEAAGPSPTNVSRVIVGVLIGVIFVLAITYRKKRHTMGWLLASVGLICLGVVVFLTYLFLFSSWTCRYVNARVVVGRTWTPDAALEIQRERSESHHELSCEDLILRFAGQTERIWNPSEIETRRVILIGLYLTVVAPFAAGMVSIIQAIQCVLEPK